MTLSGNSTTLTDLLSRFSAFSSLSSVDLSSLSSVARPFHCNTGQQLLSLNNSSEYFYCLVEGRARLLHHDPSLRRPINFAMAQPGDLVGWVSLLRRSPSEWVTAASPLKLIAIPSEHFYELETNSEAFRHWLDNSNSPSELITVLKHPLRARPTAEPNEREVMRRLIPSMRLLPARHTRELPKHPDILHLWNCVPQGFSFEPGTPVDHEILNQIPYGLPLRIFEVDREHWESELRPPLVAPPQSDFISSSTSSNYDRYDELLDVDFDSAPDSADNGEPSSFVWKNKQIPVITGVGPVESLIYCFDMLCKFHKVPFRRDIVERAAAHHFAPTLLSCL